MQVDHIIPEYLLQHPEKLHECFNGYGLANTFDLNSFENWMPACGPCNNKKRADVFEPSPIFQLLLQKAIDKAEQARNAAAEVASSAALAKALNAVERSIETDAFDFDLLEPLILAYARAKPEAMKAVLQVVDPRIISLATAPPEFLITPFYKVLYTSGAIQIVKTQMGTGYVPTDPSPHSSFYCGHCGAKGPWSGVRCLTCGMNDDGD